MATKSKIMESDFIDKILFGPRSIPFEKLGPFSATGRPLPKYAIVMEVDFKTRLNDGGIEELLFYFSQYHEVVDLTAYGTPAYGGIEKLIDDVCSPHFVFDNQVPIEPDPGYPYASPLSLRNETRSYVVYRLSSKNWQFGRRGFPITVGSMGEDKDYCFDAFKVPASGYGDRDPGFPFHSTANQPLDDCKVAFFISDGEEARADVDDDQYSHAINLHVDVEYKTPPRRIPIMLDPDVRFPGGANP